MRRFPRVGVTTACVRPPHALKASAASWRPSGVEPSAPRGGRSGRASASVQEAGKRAQLLQCVPQPLA
eukprot:365029-Chlamydomonas_euryale.AAC.3